MPIQLTEEVAVSIPVRRPGAAIAAAVAEAVGPAPVAGDKRKSHLTLDEHNANSIAWKTARTDAFAAEDLQSIIHREGLDRRVAGLRVRAEAIGAELIEMVDEYADLQRRDDAREIEREVEYETLCVGAEAHGEEPPAPPGSIGQYYDATRGLRDVDGKLTEQICDQRRDRPPDWLASLASVYGATGQAWMEMSEPPNSLTDPDEQYVIVAKRRLEALIPGSKEHYEQRDALAVQEKAHQLRRAVVDAAKALGEHVRAQWRPEYNLANHADGTTETIEANVIEGGAPFDYNDRYGRQWLRYLQRTERVSEDFDAPWTGPRADGRLDFGASGRSELPLDYSHLNREAAIRNAIPLLSEEEIEAHLEAHSKAYTKAVRVEWHKHHPNERLTAAMARERQRDLAACQLIKARLDRVALPEPEPEPEPEAVQPVAIEGLAPVSDVCEPSADAEVVEPDEPTEAVAERLGEVALDNEAADLYDALPTPTPFEKPWYNRA